MSNLNLNTISSLDTGREVDVNRVMQTVDYTSGLVIDSLDTVITDGNDRYVLASNTPIPYTTTGSGMPEGGAFVGVGDSVLRNDLAAQGGTSLIGNSAIVFNSVADMVAATWLEVGDKVRTLGYYTLGDGGGNDYEIVSVGAGVVDGGSFINLGGINGQAKGLFWDGYINVNQFGAVSSDTPSLEMAEHNTTAIQAAIDMLPDSSTLDLNGVNVRVQKGAAHTGYPDNDQPCLVVYQKNNVVIRNGTLSVGEHGQGAIEFHSCVGCRLEGVSIKGAGNFPPIDGTTGRAEKGHWLSGEGDFTTKPHSDFEGYFDRALHWLPARRNNAVDSSTYSTGGFGGNFPQWGGGTASTWGVWNGGYIGNYGHGVTLFSSNFCSVVGCTISDFNGSGVYIKYGTDSTISGNKIHGNYIAGIEVFATSGGENLIIRDNFISEIGHPDASIEHDNLDPGYGIATNNGASPTKNIIITNNMIKNTKRKGIDAHSANRLLVEGNTVDGAGFGIQLVVGGAADVLTDPVFSVTNNTIRHITYTKLNRGSGISLRNAGTNKGSAVVSGNILEDIGTPPNVNNDERAYKEYAIHVFAIDRCVIQGNVINNPTYYGEGAIMAPHTTDPGINSNIIMGNNISGKFLNGVFAAGGGRLTDITVNCCASNNLIELADVSDLTSTVQRGLHLSGTGTATGNFITCATEGSITSNRPQGSSISMDIAFPSLAITNIVSTNMWLEYLTITASSTQFGVKLALDDRLPEAVSSSFLKPDSGGLWRTSDNASIDFIYERTLRGGDSYHLGLATQKSHNVAGSDASGKLRVTIFF